MNNNESELRITEKEGDVIDIFLSPDKTPETYRRKKYELMHCSGMTEEEAENHLSITPVPLELFYDIDRGLFGVEAEAGECCEVYNPFTGKEIPNENLPTKEEKSPHKRLDEILGELEDLNSELRTIWETIDVLDIDSERIENARYGIDEALGYLHAVGDKEEEE